MIVIGVPTTGAIPTFYDDTCDDWEEKDNDGRDVV
jgi:hypothetical protein